MIRLWLRISVGVIGVLLCQYILAQVILGESDLDSYELAGFTISNSFVYHQLVADRGGMTDQASLVAVLEQLHIPLCELHVNTSLPYPIKQAVDIPLHDDHDQTWEELCEAHDLLRLVIDEQPQLPSAYLFFLDDQRPIVAFQTDDQQAWLGIDPVGDDAGSTDWAELIPFILLNGLLAISLAWFVSGPLARRAKRLSLLSQSLAQGNLSLRSEDIGSDSLGVLGQNFNYMADSLQRVIEDQRDLLRAVAHELRTPLARIGVAIGIAEINQPAIHEQMNSIQEDLQELEGLIAEITEFLRLEHGQNLQHEMFDVQQISHEIIKHEMQDVDHLQVSLSASGDDLQLRGHLNSFKRCLGNLLRNAGRYAQETISLSITTTPDVVKLVIEDDGPGFPPQMIDDLTSAFVTTSNGRLGLGLALCRRIVELSGGNLELSASTTLGGAAVTISQPKH